MRGPAPSVNEPSLDLRLKELDVQLRDFEGAVRAQQARHGHVRALELELASVAARGAALIRDLASLRNQIRDSAEALTREALAASGDRVQQFEQRAARILEAYAIAVRAAQQAVARAEARIDAFDDRVGRELAQAGREIREAALLLRDQSVREPVPSASQGPAPSLSKGASTQDVPLPRARRLIPALLAAALLLAGFAAYSWVARTLRDASARADAAEHQALETRRDANRQIASIERSAQQASSEALSIAARAERMAAVLAAPDARRTVLVGQRSAAAATGQALWSPSRGVVITGTRMPSLAATEAHQVWLTTTRGTVSLGFLTSDAQGRASGTFDFPLNLAGSILGFMVTREPVGGSARPSGAVVLAS